MDTQTPNRENKILKQQISSLRKVIASLEKDIEKILLGGAVILQQNECVHKNIQQIRQATAFFEYQILFCEDCKTQLLAAIDYDLKRVVCTTEELIDYLALDNDIAYTVTKLATQAIPHKIGD